VPSFSDVKGAVKEKKGKKREKGKGRGETEEKGGNFLPIPEF